MTAAQRASVSRHMKAYHARRRAAAQAANGSTPTVGAAIPLVNKDELAKEGARLRLTKIEAEADALRRFLKTG